MTPSLTLSIYDYIIFAATLMVCALIGIYYGCYGYKQISPKEYLWGSKTIGILPIAISLTVSHFSGTVVVGMPAEVFRYGASMWLSILAFLVMGVLAIYVYLPVFYNLQLTSIYEYLEKRFDRKTRMLAFILYVISEVMHFPVQVYSPALAFSTASGINLNLIVLILCAVCIFYTTLGGLRSVIWTDVFQFIVIMVALLVISVLGLKASGGFSSLWKIAEDGQRLDILNFSLDPTQRDTFWGYSLGLGTYVTAQVVVHQSGFQKFIALSRFNQCAWTVFNMFVTFAFVHSFMVFVGLEAYVYYKDCDPLISKKNLKHDQLFARYVTDIASNVPGISGLFIASICAASLSSMSSNLNAFCAVVYKDLICIFLKRQLSEKQSAFILKMIALVLGILCTCLVFAVEQLGELISITLMISGITQGPLLGVFTLGVLFPRANRNGAFYGTIGGVIGALGLIVPSKYYQMKGYIKSSPKHHTSVAGCEVILNSTLSTSVSTSTSEFLPSSIFRTTFHYYTIIGALMTILIGLLVSFMTKKKSVLDKSLINPYIHWCLPKNTKQHSKTAYATIEAASSFLEGNDKQ